MQKQQELDICLPPDVYIKTHNYSLAGSNPAYLYPVLYTGLRPFRFPSLLCLTPAPRSVGEHDGVGHRRGSSLLREEDQYPPPADIQNHLLGKAGNPSAYIHTGSYG